MGARQSISEEVWQIDPDAQKSCKELRREIASSNLAALSAWSPGAPDDFVVSYVKGDRIVSPKMGAALSLQRCSHWLSFKYPNKLFTIFEVQRCYEILCLVLKKANHIECMSDTRTDVCWDNHDTYLIRDYLTFTTGRFTSLKLILEAEQAVFMCYDVNRQEEPEWSPDNPDYPYFTLKHLLENDESYKIFQNFWETIPTFEQVEQVLLKFFPRDIVHCIILISLQKD